MLVNKVRVALQKTFAAGRTPVKVMVHPSFRDGLRHELTGTALWHKNDRSHFIFGLPLQALENVLEPLVAATDTPTHGEVERAERCRQIYAHI